MKLISDTDLSLPWQAIMLARQGLETSDSATPDTVSAGGATMAPCLRSCGMGAVAKGKRVPPASPRQCKSAGKPDLSSPCRDGKGSEHEVKFAGRNSAHDESARMFRAETGRGNTASWNTPGVPVILAEGAGRGCGQRPDKSNAKLPPLPQGLPMARGEGWRSKATRTAKEAAGAAYLAGCPGMTPEQVVKTLEGWVAESRPAGPRSPARPAGRLRLDLADAEAAFMAASVALEGDRAAFMANAMAAFPRLPGETGEAHYARGAGVRAKAFRAANDGAKETFSLAHDRVARARAALAEGLATLAAVKAAIDGGALDTDAADKAARIASDEAARFEGLEARAMLRREQTTGDRPPHGRLNAPKVGKSGKLLPPAMISVRLAKLHLAPPRDATAGRSQASPLAPGPRGVRAAPPSHGLVPEHDGRC